MKRIDERQGIGPCFAGCLSNFNNTGDVGSQLGDDGQPAGISNGRHNFGGHLRIRTIVDAAADVRARNIQFQPCQIGEGIELFGHLDEFGGILARDVGDDRRSHAKQALQMLCDEGIQAIVVETD